MIRVDLHTHSRYSLDAWSPPVEMVERALAVGLDRIAITDHGEVAGGLEAHAQYPEHVIVGEEIHCRCGTHLIGLFLSSRIPNGLDLDETAEHIRGQGGVVYAPHPYAYARNGAWHAARGMRVADAVEVFNSRAFLPRWNRSAAAAVRERGLHGGAGTDAHFPWELGRAFTEMPQFTGAAEFLRSLAEARPVGLRTGSPLLHVGSLALERIKGTARRLVGAGQPGRPEEAAA